MSTSYLVEGVIPSRSETSAPAVTIPQYSRRAIIAVWAAAALPMAALAWIIAPLLAGSFSGAGLVPMAKALIVAMTTGLVWQFVLIAVLIGREQRSLRWSAVREALWLRSPVSPRTGRRGGRVWFVLLPFIAAFALRDMLVPSLPSVTSHDFGAFLSSTAGQSFVHGNWAWYGVLLVLFLFNTVLGEELLFRGFLLPRMERAFGRADWIVNGLLFTAYHLHMPWGMPGILLDTLFLAYPTKRYRSAWMGIAVHSAQSVFLAVIVFVLVVR